MESLLLDDPRRTAVLGREDHHVPAHDPGPGRIENGDVEQIPRDAGALRLPVGATVRRDEDRPAVAHHPTVRGIGEPHAIETAGRAGALRGPTGAAVRGGIDPAIGRHDPEVRGVGAAGADEPAARAQASLGPRGAAVRGGRTRSLPITIPCAASAKLTSTKGSTRLKSAVGLCQETPPSEEKRISPPSPASQPREPSTKLTACRSQPLTK